VTSSGIPEFDDLLDSGYPERTTVLVMGPTGTEKEVIAYKFVRSALQDSCLCIFVTNLSVTEVSRDFRAFGVDISPEGIIWYAKEGSTLKFQNDLTKISFEIKDLLKKNSERKIRIVLDAVSSLLMLNSPDTVYRFLDQLLSEVKLYDAILLAVLEEGMHQAEILVSIEQLFDGVLELRPQLDREGEKIPSIVQIKKMRGVSLKENIFSLSLEAQMQSSPIPRTPNFSDKKHRVAVLPFSNISPDRSDEYFADGMTDELISRLSSIAGLRVIARTSVLGYKGSTKRIPIIAKELGVGSLLEGSVRKAGNNVRITIQLVDADSEERMWSGVFDRDILNIFSVQGDVAENVAKALRVELTGDERLRVERRETQNLSAYLFYLQGRRKLGEFSTESFKEALHYFDMAISEDPNYASAYAGIALGYSAMAGWGFSRPGI